MRRALVLPVVIAAAALAACGGDDPLSEDEYGTQLDDACTELADTVRSIPQRANDEDLDPDEAIEIADQAGDDFTETVEGLEPPDALSDAHDDLIELAGEDPQGDDLESAVEVNQRYEAVFAELGADECAALQREGAEQLQQNNPTPP